MDTIEADMLQGVPHETVDAIRVALLAFARSLEASSPLPTPRAASVGRTTQRLR
jgi:hypothetical protein